MIINGQTEFLTLLGCPIRSVKAPMIYNPFLEEQGINLLLLPVEVAPEHLAGMVRALFSAANFRGTLVTMPHKVAVMDLLDKVSPTAAIAGASNAIRKTADGLLEGDMFDGEGFVAGMRRNGYAPEGKKALVVGAGGVGSAIAASLAAAGVNALGICDTRTAVTDALAGRLKHHYPALEILTGSADPRGYDIVVNATPMGMNENDPMPLDTEGLNGDMFVGDVVMKKARTPFLQAAAAKGCKTQIGTDMLFEQIPAYLAFFNLPSTTAEHLQEVATIQYV